MESKKINQLATELAPDLSDITIIGDPTTGISKKITLSQMASLFTGTVEEYANFAAFPITGVADTIYVAKDTNVIYRWDSTAYVVLSPNVIASLVFNDANGFDGTIALVGSVATLTITTALTSGSVPFIGASGALTQDNANLFFDDTNNRLGINTNAPTTALDVFGSGIIGRINGTSTNNSFLGFSSAGTNKWSIGNVQSDHRFRIFSEANSAELITILQTGEFGIGIANPTTKFHIDGAASALIANLDANVSIAKSVSYRSDNSARINLEVSGTESGSNAGADFFLRTYTDAGSLLETPFSIVRSTGLATFKNIAITGLTSGYLPKANGSSALSNSLIWDNGTNVGIGNTNTSYTLDVSGTGRFTGNGYVGGNLGVGTLIPSGIVNGLGLVVYDTNYPRVILQNSTTGTGTGAYSGLFAIGSDIYFGNSSATGKLYFAVNSSSSAMSINSAGGVSLEGYLTGQGTNPGGLGGSRYVIDWLSGNMRIFSYGADASTNGGFTFNSQRSDGTNSSDRINIQSNGLFTFGEYSSTSTGYKFRFNGNGAGDVMAIVLNGGTAATTSYIAFRTGTGEGSYKADIRYETGALSLNNISDVRFKENIVDASTSEQWNKVKNSKLRKFDFKDRTATNQLGFIAQELYNTIPEAISKGGDEEEFNGNEKSIWTIASTNMIPTMFGALQEAMAKIETLQTQNDALQSRIETLESK